MRNHCHGRILKDQRELQQDWCIFWMWIILINIIGQTIIHSWREILRTNKIIIGKRNYCNNKHDKILPFLNLEQQITNNFQTNLLSITFKRLFEEKERIITPFSFTKKRKNENAHHLISTYRVIPLRSHPQRCITSRNITSLPKIRKQ